MIQQHPCPGWRKAFFAWMSAMAMILTTSLAQAAPGWSPPVQLAPPLGLFTLQIETSVALDPLGDAVAVWNANGVIQAASQVRGGAWSAPTDISLAGDYEDVYEPQVAIGPYGAALAVWTSTTAVPDQVRVYAIKVATKRVNGPWTAPTTIISTTAGGLGSPRIAVDVFGNALAVWQSALNGRGVIQAAAQHIGRAWSTPAAISPQTSDAAFPQLAVSPLGQAVAVWQVFEQPGNPTTVQAATRNLAGLWSAAVNISTPTPQTWNPHVAIDAVGRAVAVWNQATVITAATRAANGQWSAPIALSSSGLPSYGVPAVAMDLAGNALAAWSEFDGFAAMQVAARPAGGAWRTPTQLSTMDEDVSDPRVAMGPFGLFMVVTWVDNATNTARAVTALGKAAWSAPVTLGNGIWSSSVEVAATVGAQARALWGAPLPPREAWTPEVSSFTP